MLIAVINANGEGTIIRIEDLPDDFEDDDLAPILHVGDFDKKAIILDDIPESVEREMVKFFPTYHIEGDTLELGSTETVTLQASGYEWDCPICRMSNASAGRSAVVACTSCGEQFVVDDVVHGG